MESLNGMTQYVYVLNMHLSMPTGQTGLPPNQPTGLKVKNLHNFDIFQPIWLRKTSFFSNYHLSAYFLFFFRIGPPALTEHFFLSHSLSLFSFLVFLFLSFTRSPSSANWRNDSANSRNDSANWRNVSAKL